MDTSIMTIPAFIILFLVGFFSSRYIRYRKAERIRREKAEFIRTIPAERINMMDDKE